MDIESCLINDVQALEISDLVSDSQKIFSELTYSHLPVLEKEVFMGSLAETDARCLESSATLSSIKYALDGFHVTPDVHWLDVLEKFAQHDSNVMPVLDQQQRYLGYYELKDILQLFNDAPFLYESGAVVVIEKGTTDYSFSEIAQIVESNGAKLFGVFVSNYDDHLTQITLKISPQQLNEVLQTFRRYSYSVVTSAQDDSYLDSLKERSDYLNKYLDM
jgi:Mg/Co/Ni transporter MgtE